MEDYNYMRAVLKGYTKLGALSEAAQTRAENLAMLSYKKFETLQTMYEIMDEIAFSETALALKRALDRILPALREEERFLLEVGYFRRKRVLLSFKGVRLPRSRRQYFRRIGQLNRKIGRQLELCGLTRERIERDAGDLFRMGQNSSSGELFFPLNRKIAIPTAAAQARQMTTIPATGKPSSV